MMYGPDVGDRRDLVEDLLLFVFLNSRPLDLNVSAVFPSALSWLTAVDYLVNSYSVT